MNLPFQCKEEVDMTQLVKNVLKIFIVPQNIHKQIWFSNSWKLICFQLKQTDQWLSSVTAVNKHFISNRRINRNHRRNNYFHTYVYKKKGKELNIFVATERTLFTTELDLVPPTRKHHDLWPLMWPQRARDRDRATTTKKINSKFVSIGEWKVVDWC